ncbi:MAG: hypothetical protein WC236_14655 [Gallionellaceae bacterium]
MADTKGLLATRKLYMDAVEAGETDLDHKAWYENLMKQKAAEAADAQKGFDSAQASTQNPKG